MTTILLYTGLAALGVLVGLFSTGLGLGGGVLMMPFFISIVPHMDVHTAKGTSLFIILLVALSGLPRIRRLQAQKPSLRPAALITFGALVGGYIGAAITVRLPETVILLLFLAFVLFLMLRLMLESPKPLPTRTPVHRDMLLFCSGLLAGGVGSATGTGGGAVLAPLVLLTGLLPHTQLVYVANQVMIATSLAAAPAHFMAERYYTHHVTVGHISLGLVPVILIFAQIGLVLGARLNRRLRAHQRRRLLACVLLLVALRIGLHII